MEIIFTPPDECIQCVLGAPCTDCPMFSQALGDDKPEDRLKRFLIHWALTGGPLHLLTDAEKEEGPEE